MSRASVVQRQQQTAPVSDAPSGILQRKCACGKHTGAGGKCDACRGREDQQHQKQLPIQTKLKIGRPDDKYEQEADRVAEMVMRMPAPAVERVVTEDQENKQTIQSASIADRISPLIQRQVDEEEENDAEELLQAKRASGHSPSVTPDVAKGIQSLRGGGQPLPPSTRSFFQPRFGHDFSQVRVHTGAEASRLARNVNSRAFTVGRDVVFGNSEYQTTSADGHRLLAHELTHVVQQQSQRLPQPMLQRQDVTICEKGKEKQPGVAVAYRNGRCRYTMETGKTKVADMALAAGFSDFGVVERTFMTTPCRDKKPFVNRITSGFYFETEGDQIVAFGGAPSYDKSKTSCTVKPSTRATRKKTKKRSRKRSKKPTRKRSGQKTIQVKGSGVRMYREINVQVNVKPPFIPSGTEIKVSERERAEKWLLVTFPNQQLSDRLGETDGSVQVYVKKSDLDADQRTQKRKRTIESTERVEPPATAESKAPPSMTDAELIALIPSSVGTDVALGFFAGFKDGLGQVSFRALATKLGVSMLFSSDFTLSVRMGMMEGIKEELLGYYELAANIDKVAKEVANTLFKLLVGPDAKKFGQELGRKAGTDSAKQLADLADQPAGEDFGRALGKLLGPLVLDVLIGIATEGAGAAMLQVVKKTAPTLFRWARRLPEMKRGSPKRSSGRRSRRRPNRKERRLLRKRVKDPKNIRESSEPGFDVEIEIESASGKRVTYRRTTSDGTWCRFASKECGLDAGDKINDAADKKTAKRARERANAILEEFAEGQQKAAREDVQAEALEQHGRGSRETPGGAPVPKKFEVGNFAHDYAEQLIPKSELPRGLDKEYKIPETHRRIDRVDWKKGWIYEIKPDTKSQVAAGNRQLRLYIDYMNEKHPLSGNRKWTGKVVTYDKAAVIRVLKKIGWLV